MSDIDRTPKPCLHKRAHHRHGERTTYALDRCRCLPCCYAASVYEHNRTKRNAYGRSNYIDAGPAREQVAKLMAAGIGLKRIVKTSGVPQGVLWKLVYGKTRPDGSRVPSRRVTRATEGRLLALNPTDLSLLAEGARVPGFGAARRLQALTCLGWSISRLASESGIDRQALDHAIHGGQIVAGHARAITALYERLWDQQPPVGHHRDRISVARASNRARAAGWAPPLAWDEDTIDDPAAVPALDEAVDLVDEFAVELVLEGDRLQLTGATLHAAVQALVAAGHQPGTIADRLGIDERQVYRLRDRASAPRPMRRGEAA